MLYPAELRVRVHTPSIVEPAKARICLDVFGSGRAGNHVATNDAGNRFQFGGDSQQRALIGFDATYGKVQIIRIEFHVDVIVHGLYDRLLLWGWGKCQNVCHKSIIKKMDAKINKA